MPPIKRRPAVDLPTFDLGELKLSEEHGLKATKRRKPLDLVAIDDWI